MKPNARVGCLALFCLLLTPVVLADTPAATETEVNYLLDAVATSNCAFRRNGTWYDGKKAAAHLRLKYQYLKSRNLVRTTDDFIERGATRSSFTGREYTIGCAGSADVPAAQWLRSLRARYHPQQPVPVTPTR